MDNSLNWRALSLAGIIAVITLAALTLILALALRFTTLSESFLDYLVILFLAGSAFSGSCYLVRQVDQKILYHTLLLSLIFILFLLVIGLFFYGPAMTWTAWLGNIVAILTGSIAGALVNAR